MLDIEFRQQMRYFLNEFGRLEDSMHCNSAVVDTCKVFPILEMEDTMMPSGFMIVWQDLELSWRMLQMVTVDSPASFWWFETETPPEAGSTTLALPRHFRILKPNLSTVQSILIALLQSILIFFCYPFYVEWCLITIN